MKALLIKVQVLLLVVGLSGKVYSAPDLAELLASMDQQRGQFEQILVNTEGEMVQTSSGRFALKQPGKFRWQTEAPFSQLLVCDGTTLWLYDPDLEQVTVRAVDADPANPMRLISGELVDLNADYTVTNLVAEPDRAVFRLQPKQANDYFKLVTLSFEKQQLTEMLIQDVTGNVNRIRFSKVLTDTAMSAEQFSFDAPPGTDVIVDG